jgi:predicted RNA-binding protein associated with RNAse of E/G family
LIPAAETDFSYTYIRPPGRVSVYNTKLLHADESAIVMLHPSVQPSQPAIYFGEEVLSRDYNLLWFLLNGQPFDVARFYRPDGTWTGYYIDILEPVRWSDADPATLRPIVDLFLDVWIAPDGRRQVLDEDELEEALEAGHVSIEQVVHAQRTVEKISKAADRGVFPPRIAREFPFPGNSNEAAG